MSLSSARRAHDLGVTSEEAGPGGKLFVRDPLLR